MEVVNLRSLHILRLALCSTECHRVALHLQGILCIIVQTTKQARSYHQVLSKHKLLLAPTINSPKYPPDEWFMAVVITTLQQAAMSCPGSEGLASLPDELLVYIFSFLPPEFICETVASVSHRFHLLATCDEYWGGVAAEYYASNPVNSLEYPECFARRYYQRLRALERRWNKGRCRVSRVDAGLGLCKMSDRPRVTFLCLHRGCFHCSGLRAVSRGRWGQWGR